MNQTLKNIIKQTINNSVCSCQSLDVAKDRERVINQLIENIEPSWTNIIIEEMIKMAKDSLKINK